MTPINPEVLEVAKTWAHPGDAYRISIEDKAARMMACELVRIAGSVPPSQRRIDVLEEAARAVEKIGHDHMHEHGSYDSSTNSWDIHHKHADRLEALDDAVDAIRKLQGAAPPSEIEPKFKDFAARCRPAVKGDLLKSEQLLLKGKDGTFAPHYLKHLEHNADRARRLLDEIDALIGPESDSGPHEPPIPPHHFPVA